MTLAPMPLAPRPQPGEAISSWMRRIAARYDLTGDDLAAFILRKDGSDLDLSAVDYRCYTDLEAGLSVGARWSRKAISSMRLVAPDGSASYWHRHDCAWCVDCVREDIAQRKECYERAQWRLGCFVICPIHNRRLFMGCIHCTKGSVCSYQPVDGLLRLACCGDGHRLNPAKIAHDQDLSEIPFGIEFRSEIKRAIIRLQGDLQLELAGRIHKPGDRRARSPSDLLSIAETITRAIVMSHGIRFHPRMAQLLVDGRRLVTPAALPIGLALGAMAIIAVLVDRSDSHTMWRPAGRREILDRATFTRWLREPARQLIQRRLRVWRGAAPMVSEPRRANRRLNS
jgi:hypothetical protein